MVTVKTVSEIDVPDIDEADSHGEVNVAYNGYVATIKYDAYPDNPFLSEDVNPPILVKSLMV